jgi:DNA-binding response OmpR family regulator
MADQSQARKVLFIEDEPFISELYERSLVKGGYQVRIIRDGQAGLKEANTDEYDIILLDLMLPSLTGLDILKRLRAEFPNLKAKIVITTNLEQSKERRKDIERQADAYLIKAEVTPRQLVEFLNKIK